MSSQRFFDDPAGLGVGYPVIGDNSAVFSLADPVFIDTDGFLDICTTSSKILGYSLATLTMASDNETVAQVCPQYVYQEGVLMVYPITGAGAATQTMVGSYTVFSDVTSGGFTTSASDSDTVGQLFIVGINPVNGGSTTAGSATELSELVVKAAFKQTDTYAAS